jgi:hypothetical protein
MLFSIAPIREVEYRVSETLDERFKRWIEVNPHVVSCFAHFALQARERGQKRIGAKMIVERMRWEWLTHSIGDEFKLNNSYTSRLVREAIRKHPSLERMFEVRRLRT